MAHIISPTENQIVINAILTKTGRSKLASGVDLFNITKFAVADDEIDYSIQNIHTVLQNNAHQYKILQPVLKGGLFMRNKLYTSTTVNAGERVLTFIKVDTLSEEVVNTMTAIVGSQTSYTPATIGHGTELYNISLSFNDTVPFSDIKYIDANGATKTYEIEGRTQFTIPNAASIIFRKKDITTPKNFEMEIQGVDTGAIAIYSFLLEVSPTSTNVVNQEEVK